MHLYENVRNIASTLIVRKQIAVDNEKAGHGKVRECDQKYGAADDRYQHLQGNELSKESSSCKVSTFDQ